MTKFDLLNEAEMVANFSLGLRREQLEEMHTEHMEKAISRPTGTELLKCFTCAVYGKIVDYVETLPEPKDVNVEKLIDTVMEQDLTQQPEFMRELLKGARDQYRHAYTIPKISDFFICVREEPDS